MKKYQIIEVPRDKKSYEIVGTAASKAPHDVTLIARRCGYLDKYLIIPRIKNKVINVIVRLYCLIRAIRSCEKDSVVLFQYPCISEKLFQYAKFFFKDRKIIAVVHDMNSIREAGALSKAEIASLSVFSEIIVHTPEMEQYLSPYFSNDVKFHVLECFPYLSSSECVIPSLSNEVCYAGNLDKGAFLHKFLPTVKNIKIKLYGKMDCKLELDDKTEYCGMFRPDDITTLRGSWGLIWDGDSLDSYSGTWGEYHRIIAPHKFSLYMAAGIPVIVWNKSAMARIVNERRIGLTISSLRELEVKTSEVTNNRYNAMIIAIMALKSEIISGKYLMSLLSY